MSSYVVTFVRGLARSNRRSLRSSDPEERKEAADFVNERRPVYVLCEAILSAYLGWSDRQTREYFLSGGHDSFHPYKRLKVIRKQPEIMLIDGKIIRR